MTRKILFITGTRADFGKLKPFMRAIEESQEFSCSIFVTGMHMLKKYGNTLNEIRKEKFRDIFPFYNQMRGTSNFMDLTLAETVKGLSYYVSEHRPDLLIVHGDRIEALAGAIVGALQGIRTAHVEGGEKSGTVDEIIRHAVTKLSHIHFVANEENRQRLLQLGENRNSIFISGSPDIDVMLSETLPDFDSVCQHYDISFSDYSILIYHPVVTELEKLRENIEEVIEGVKQTGANFIVIYPNNDPGSDIILEKMRQLDDRSRYRCFPSIRFESFLTLVKSARAVIGNSSCGIHEAPVYGVPTINIGTRQNNRFSSDSIFNAPEDRNVIARLFKELPGRFMPNYTYGHGNSSRIFMETLQGDQIWNIPLQKSFFDLVAKRDTHAMPH